MIKKIEHKFVESIPQDLEEGILYISTRFRVAMHSCCCGCGGKVVTPLSPARWKLVYDGKTVSLEPSIGNWEFDCESHYWITRSQIEWARKWSKEEIAAGKSNERERRAKHFEEHNLESKPVEVQTNTSGEQEVAKSESWITRTIDRVKNIFK